MKERHNSFLKRMAARNLASRVVLLEKQNNTVQLMTEIKTKKILSLTVPYSLTKSFSSRKRKTEETFEKCIYCSFFFVVKLLQKQRKATIGEKKIV